MYHVFVGFTLLSYVDIVTAGNGGFRGYISSMNKASDGRYGAAIVGHLGKIE